MTADEFRKLALALPETTEGEHMDHPDFRVGGKIFATLDSPEEGWGMVKLDLDTQEEYLEAHPDVFVPAKGAWGMAGATHVKLDAVSKTLARAALQAAW